MGRNVGYYWKTNDRDIACFARACAIVVKHPECTPKLHNLVARIFNHLRSGRDISLAQKKAIIRFYREKTNRIFSSSGTSWFQYPHDHGAQKAEVFFDTLGEYGVMLFPGETTLEVLDEHTPIDFAKAMT